MNRKFRRAGATAKAYAMIVAVAVVAAAVAIEALAAWLGGRVRAAK